MYLNIIILRELWSVSIGLWCLSILWNGLFRPWPFFNEGNLHKQKELLEAAVKLEDSFSGKKALDETHERWSFVSLAPTHGLTTRKSKQAMWIQTFWWIWAMLMDSLAILVPWLCKWGGLQAFAAWTRERAGETWGQQKDLLQKALEKLRHDGHTESLATWSWLCYYLDVFGHFFVDIFA